MKWFAFSCLLSLALVVGDARAEMRAQRGGDPSPQQAAPNQNPPPSSVQPPTSVRQNPRPEPVRQPSGVIHTLPGAAQKPSGVLNKPSGVLNTPSGVLNKPSGVLNKPSGVLTSPGATFAQPKQNFVGGQREFRRFRHDGDSHRGDFRRGGRRSSFIVVYINSAPCWYPVYTAYPYYYEAPPTVVDEGTTYIPTVEESGGGGAVQTAPGYDELGRMWGQDLRRDVVTWEEFVDYLKSYIINAPPEAQADFREAFIDSYGINGAAAYDKAADQAAQPSPQGPKIINVQPAN